MRTLRFTGDQMVGNQGVTIARLVPLAHHPDHAPGERPALRGWKTLPTHRTSRIQPVAQKL